QNDSVTPHVCLDGPFRLVANSFNYQKTMTLAGLPRNPALNAPFRQESLNFQFTIQSEPKLPLMSIGMPKLVKATDDLGNDMPKPVNQHETHYGYGYRTFVYNANLSLTWPVKEAKFVKSLKGSLPVTILAEQKPEITVENVLKVKKQKFSGPTAELT